MLTPHQRERLEHLTVIERAFGGELGWTDGGIDPYTAADALEFMQSGKKLPGDWELNAAETAGQRLLDAAKAMRAALKPLTPPKLKKVGGGS